MKQAQEAVDHLFLPVHCNTSIVTLRGQREFGSNSVISLFRRQHLERRPSAAHTHPTQCLVCIPPPGFDFFIFFCLSPYLPTVPLTQTRLLTNDSLKVSTLFHAAIDFIWRRPDPNDIIQTKFGVAFSQCAQIRVAQLSY